MNIKNCFLSLIGQFLPLSKSLCLTRAPESDRHRVEATSPLPVIHGTHWVPSRLFTSCAVNLLKWNFWDPKLNQTITIPVGIFWWFIVKMIYTIHPTIEWLYSPEARPENTRVTFNTALISWSTGLTAKFLYTIYVNLDCVFPKIISVLILCPTYLTDGRGLTDL